MSSGGPIISAKKKRMVRATASWFFHLIDQLPYLRLRRLDVISVRFLPGALSKRSPGRAVRRSPAQIPDPCPPGRTYRSAILPMESWHTYVATLEGVEEHKPVPDFKKKQNKQRNETNCREASYSPNCGSQASIVNNAKIYYDSWIWQQGTQDSQKCRDRDNIDAGGLAPFWSSSLALKQIQEYKVKIFREETCKACSIPLPFFCIHNSVLWAVINCLWNPLTSLYTALRGSCKKRLTQLCVGFCVMWLVEVEVEVWMHTDVAYAGLHVHVWCSGECSGLPVPRVLWMKGSDYYRTGPVSSVDGLLMKSPAANESNKNNSIDLSFTTIGLSYIYRAVLCQLLRNIPHEWVNP